MDSSVKENRDNLIRYLRERYRGVFNERQINRYLDDYVGLDIAAEQLELLLQVDKDIKRVLDIGCGFGSFVYSARLFGIDAQGIDISDFEIQFARERIGKSSSGSAGKTVYYHGDALSLPFENNYFDAVTLWNVLEHIRDYKKLLAQAIMVLKPEGCLFVVCPNYASFRMEAHYQVPWVPFLPKSVGKKYLSFLRKNPGFLQSEIFYRTNWGVISALKDLGLKVFDPRKQKLINPDNIKNLKARKLVQVLKHYRLMWLANMICTVSFYNPLKYSVVLYAVKK